MFELKAKSNSQTDMLLYGSIGEWSKVRADDIWRSLQDAKAKGYDNVKFRVNCPGGSIFEGIAAISAIDNSGVKVSACIDGLAASMASALIAAIDDVEMTEGARIMIHQGSGGVYGQAWQMRDQADLLDSLNRTIAEYLSKKTGKDKQWILDNWMAAGKDKWFTAREALDAKLIKRIVPGKAKPLPKEESASVYDMAAHYEQFFKDDTTENEMNKEQLIALLGLKATATEAEITAALTALKAKADKAPEPEKEKEKQIELKAEAGDANSIMLLEQMAKDRGVTDEKKLAAIRTVAAINLKAALDLLPEKAEVKAAATETKEEAPKPLTVTELLNAMKGAGSGAGKKDSASWSWDDWNKPENSKAFADLLKTDPKKYAEIFNAKFGYTPTEAELKAL